VLAFPEASIPVAQLSLVSGLGPATHFADWLAATVALADPEGRRIRLVEWRPAQSLGYFALTQVAKSAHILASEVELSAIVSSP